MLYVVKTRRLRWNQRTVVLQGVSHSSTDSSECPVVPAGLNRSDTSDAVCLKPLPGSPFCFSRTTLKVARRSDEESERIARLFCGQDSEGCKETTDAIA